jgi:hypothetical protein
LVTDLAERFTAKQAGLLSQLAEQLENELCYPVAEEAYNRSLSLYRQLRSLDPVNPRYPEAVRELSEKRNALRQIRISESRFEVAVAGGGYSQEAGLTFAVTNTSGSGLQQVEVLARFSGFSPSPWRASIQALRPGGRALLTIPVAEAGAAGSQAPVRLNTEDLYIPCNLLIRYAHDRSRQAEHVRIPLVFPKGTLPLAADEPMR